MLLITLFIIKLLARINISKYKLRCSVYSVCICVYRDICVKSLKARLSTTVSELTTKIFNIFNLLKENLTLHCFFAADRSTPKTKSMLFVLQSAAD